MKKEPKKRRPYRAPKVATERIYERYGLACGKEVPMVPNCSMNLMS